MAGDRAGRRLLMGAALMVGALTAGGCGADPPAGAAVVAGPAAASTSSGVPNAVADAVRVTVDAANSAASDGPADQQARILELVDPDRRDEVTRCRAATTTVRFEPVYPGLRPLGAGTERYALPTLIRVHSGGRLTGTDLTTLQFVVRPAADGSAEAYLTPFCVN